MEEEIITPEEEVFNYHTLRYILDKEGYVCHASLGGFIVCNLGECTEYKGEVPDGYETIEEWHDKEIERLNAWKIVDGNLVFDENRSYKLSILYEQQNNENSCVTRKEMGMASTEEINPYTDLFPSHESAMGNISTCDEKVNKVGNLPTEEVNLVVNEEQDLDLIELEFIGNNFLPNTATSSINNGITYTQNKDKTINVSGTATDKSTLNLAGTDTSVRNILTFKGNTSYYDDAGEIIERATNYLLFDLPNGVNLEFYKFDGTDRTLIGIYHGGIISFAKDTNITQVVLSIDSGVTIDTTLKPMLVLLPLKYPLLSMTKYVGDGDKNGQYYIDGISTQNGTPTPNAPIGITNTYPAGTYSVLHNNTLFTFTLDEDLRGLPNGLGDRLWFDLDGNNGICIERKVARVILDGSGDEGWAYTAGVYQLTVPNIKGLWDNVQPIMLSSHFIPVPNKSTYNTGEIVQWLQNQPYIGFVINEYTSIDDFKTWLSINNVELYYELSTSAISSVYSYSHDTYEYEEYKNNTTLIDLSGNEFAIGDDITIIDNQIILIKKNGEEIFLGDTVMPRTYTPYTHAYCHQKVMVKFKYKDPRNVDITKITLKGLLSITDIETEYNFTLEDAEKVVAYTNGEIDLTDDELENYDINADGVVDKLDATAIMRMYYGYISNIVKGTLEINSTKAQRTIVLRDEEGKLKTSIGLNGITTPSLSVNGVLVEENIQNTETPTTTLLNDKRVYKRLFTGSIPSTTGSATKLFGYDFDFAKVWIDESNSFIYSDSETLGINWYNTSSDYLRTIINKANKQVNYKSGKDLSSFTYNIVLAYTKDDESDEPVEPDTPVTPTTNTKTISDNGSKGHHKFTLEVNENSVSGTKSTLDYSFKLSPIQKGWDWSSWGNSISYSIAIGDNSYSGTIPAYDGSSTVTLKSGSNIEIEHNSDGTKTIPISFTVTDGAGQSYTCGNASASDEMVLTAIL